MYRLVGDIPILTILGEPYKYVHLHRLVVAAEHTGIAVAEWHHGTVENTVGVLCVVSPDDGVFG